MTSNVVITAEPSAPEDVERLALGRRAVLTWGSASSAPARRSRRRSTRSRPHTGTEERGARIEPMEEETIEAPAAPGNPNCVRLPRIHFDAVKVVKLEFVGDHGLMKANDADWTSAG